MVWEDHVDTVVCDYASFSVFHGRNSTAGIQDCESVLDWCGDVGVNMLAIMENDGSEENEIRGRRHREGSREECERSLCLYCKRDRSARGG